MRLTRISAFTAIVAIGCLVIAASASASCTSLAHFGNTVVQASLNSDEAAVKICLPEHAIGARTAALIVVCAVTFLLFAPEFISRSRGAVLAAAIRPPPIA